MRNDSISSKLSALLSDIDAKKIELSGAILIFSSSINNKSKLVQAFEKSDSALIIRLFDPTKLELINIIKAKAQSENVSINKDAIDAILNDTVNDSNSLIAQMENLALYVGKGNEIGLDAIEALNVNNRESGIDEMVNALFVGNSKVCLIASNRLLKTGSAIIPMLNALMRRCLLLNTIYSEVANSRTATEIAVSYTHLDVYKRQPPDRDFEWSQSGIEGASRFVSRVWNLFYNHISNTDISNIKPISIDGLDDKALEIMKAAHKAISNVSVYIDQLKFNAAIANLYELLNTMRQFDDLKEENDINARHEALVIFLKLLQPFAPHMSEELWTLIGNEDYCMKAAWPIACLLYTSRCV